MKDNFRRLVHSIMSIVTTFILMAAPVAAIVYSSESLEPSSTEFVRNLSDIQEEDYQNKIDSTKNKTHQLKPDAVVNSGDNHQENQINQQ
ncbi:hypothetical protein SDC9_142404 [bioreactor metagenome]|uniref:Uncharacterized protein n=1 Tax=bioreactor metagenome TaxID=1076179 RepID=A0A645E0E6_9ZZZZ